MGFPYVLYAMFLLSELSSTSDLKVSNESIELKPVLWKLANNTARKLMVRTISRVKQHNGKTLKWGKAKAEYSAGGNLRILKDGKSLDIS